MRVRLQFIATLISLLAIAAGVACKKLLSQYWTDWLAYAIALFWLTEMIMSFVVERFEPHIGQPTMQGKSFMRTYLIAKGVKLLLTLSFIILGISLMDHQPAQPPLAFAGTSVALYLLHLAGETYVVTGKGYKGNKQS